MKTYVFFQKKQSDFEKFHADSRSVHKFIMKARYNSSIAYPYALLGIP